MVAQQGQPSVAEVHHHHYAAAAGGGTPLRHQPAAPYQQQPTSTYTRIVVVAAGHALALVVGGALYALWSLLSSVQVRGPHPHPPAPGSPAAGQPASPGARQQADGPSALPPHQEPLLWAWLVSVALKDTKEWVVASLRQQLSTRCDPAPSELGQNARPASAHPLVAHAARAGAQRVCVVVVAACGERRSLPGLALRALLFPLLVVRDTLHELAAVMHRAVQEERSVQVRARATGLGRGAGEGPRHRAGTRALRALPPPPPMLCGEAPAALGTSANGPDSGPLSHTVHGPRHSVGCRCCARCHPSRAHAGVGASVAHAHHVPTPRGLRQRDGG